MYQYKAKMIRVIDGDTYELAVDLGFRIYHQIHVRLHGVDTPELYRPRNEAELEHAREAKAFVEQLIPVGSYVELETFKDRAGIYNRWEAEIYLGGGETLSYLLNVNGMLKKESY